VAHQRGGHRALGLLSDDVRGEAELDERRGVVLGGLAAFRARDEGAVHR
jgi:hypothetical protein